MILSVSGEFRDSETPLTMIKDPGNIIGHLPGSNLGEWLEKDFESFINVYSYDSIFAMFECHNFEFRLYEKRSYWGNIPIDGAIILR